MVRCGSSAILRRWRHDRPLSKDTSITRLLIVDDHPVVSEGLSELINRELDLTVVAAAVTADEGLEILRSTDVDVAIVDLSLPGPSGIELIRMIRTEFPHIPVLVLSMHDEHFYAERALRAGARGYVMKGEAIKHIVEAIRKVRRGDLYLSAEVTERMLFRITAGSDPGEPGVGRLSERELEVFQLIGQGKSTREIAGMLHLSVKTIESYRANIKEKLALKNAAGLVQHAVKWVQTNLQS